MQEALIPEPVSDPCTLVFLLRPPTLPHTALLATRPQRGQEAPVSASGVPQGPDLSLRPLPHQLCRAQRRCVPTRVTLRSWPVGEKAQERWLRKFGSPIAFPRRGRHPATTLPPTWGKSRLLRWERPGPEP